MLPLPENSEEEPENDRLPLLLLPSFLEFFRPPSPPPVFPLLLLVCSPRPATAGSEPGGDDDDDADSVSVAVFFAPSKGEGSAAAPPFLFELPAALLLGWDESAAEVAPTLPPLPVPAAWLDRFPRTVRHAAAVLLATLPHTPPPPPLAPLAASPFADATVDGDPGLPAERLLALPSPAPPLTLVMNEIPGDTALLLLLR